MNNPESPIDIATAPKPKITVEFAGQNSCVAEIHIDNANSTQIAIVARMLDKYADQLFAMEQAAQSQSRLTVARGMPNLRGNGRS